MRQVLTSPNLPAPRFRYSPCIKAGPWYQFAGMSALDFKTGHREQGGAAAETAKILSNLISALPDFGLGLEHLVLARIYTTNFAEFTAINEAWESVFDASVVPPARTSVGVAALPLGASVEIEFSLYKES